SYPDGRNEYSWGNYSEPGVIAVTVVWSGVPIGGKGRQIIEYDVLFDTDYLWQIYPTNTTTQYMDLPNIATHETGHGIGLGDVYEDACSYVTMYGYSWYGEIQKRDLAQPDVTGLQKLYGA
ncbi:MAG: matrixin family metalloprotease, partial [Candidatus Aenigmatarchaeota archaeon]